ncbi:MAG TPA: hypothetical protein VJH91_01595 [Candidatus Paceibacterota bacterium]
MAQKETVLLERFIEVYLDERMLEWKAKMNETADKLGIDRSLFARALANVLRKKLDKLDSK